MDWFTGTSSRDIYFMKTLDMVNNAAGQLPPERRLASPEVPQKVVHVNKVAKSTGQVADLKADDLAGLLVQADQDVVRESR